VEKSKYYKVSNNTNHSKWKYITKTYYQFIQTNTTVLQKVRYPGNGVTSQTHIWQPIPCWSGSPANVVKLSASQSSQTVSQTFV
jgi:hypothetical protein